ncbi:MAG: putative polymerase sigma factor [Proteiniphilum sp.]|jgi:RNA polymerase sigma-70 factor (ECF subfamily)|nr:putative polymerase sigma factor [Proteiniphilum sp.]MDK2852993.1 hypothetical protein [Proteiniphilum sp.]
MEGSEFKRRFLGYGGLIYRYAFAVTGDREDAQDIVQEVYEKLWKMREMLTAVENDEAYVVSVARNSSLDRLRKRSRHRTTTLSAAMEPGDEGEMLNRLEAMEELRHMERLLSTLPENQQMAIRLRHFAGQPLSEIAEAMQLTEINVRQLLSRGRKTLKEKMKKYVYGE